MSRGIRNLSTLFIIIAGAILIARFLNENAETVTLEYFGWRTKEIAKGSLVVLSFILGIGVTTLLIFSVALSKTLEAGRLKRENRSLQRLLENQVKTPESQPGT